MLSLTELHALMARVGHPVIQAPPVSDARFADGAAYRFEIPSVEGPGVGIKEGTTGGLVTDSSLDAAALTPAGDDSCGDVKGNEWTISRNRCTGGQQVRGRLRRGTWRKCREAPTAGAVR